ncbi:hypothetical protein RRG08_005964 [Elysia crispata]|uniref:Uncharacterized protein n=1 Tax=Elysia crispata TaxID=231223 RepID=A0AAE1D2A6_9GAST|nr:hypothetical protein RRG08_005964 [Elysia crispata]
MPFLFRKTMEVLRLIFGRAAAPVEPCPRPLYTFESPLPPQPFFPCLAGNQSSEKGMGRILARDWIALRINLSSVNDERHD